MIIGVYGFQDSGKTTLAEELIKSLAMRGLRVSSIKHSPHLEDIDSIGKDTWRHSDAGSDPVVLDAASATMLMNKPGLGFNDLVGLIEREFNPDVLLVEGRKNGDFPKIALGEVEPTEGTVLVNPEAGEALEFIEREIARERIMRQLPGLDCGKCGSTCSDLASEVVDGKRALDDCLEMPAQCVEISVNGKELPVGGFVADMTEKTIRGFLSSLKGYSEGDSIEIRIRRAKTSDDDGNSERIGIP
ncbi:MAG: molybdopterin-guanine dinucleotide biosynthesis protein B [Methanobacteriota archaeon]|nr:MAG: molybdopterin-guanine dinucleotide biosynthesis protein B [Euryarchaeota archaeon]